MGAGFALAPYELIELLAAHLPGGTWTGLAKLAQLNRHWGRLVIEYRSTLSTFCMTCPPGQDPQEVMPLGALWRLAACKSLTDLELVGLGYDSVDWRYIPNPIVQLASPGRLRKLVLTPAPMFLDWTAHAISHCRGLEDLQLSEAGPLSVGAMRALGSCPLVRVDLEYSDVEDDGLVALVLQARHTLQCISTLRSRMATDTWAFSAVACCAMLREIKWHCLAGNTLRAIASIAPQHLTTVRLGPHATDDWVALLVAACPAITDFALEAEGLTDSALSSVAKLACLRLFSLSDIGGRTEPRVRFSPDGLQELAECTQLRSLALHGCALEGHGFDGVLVAIAKSCRSLSSLWLAMCGFGPRAIKRFAPCCPTLESICLAMCQSSLGAVRALKRSCLSLRLLLFPEGHCKMNELERQLAATLFAPGVIVRPSELCWFVNHNKSLEAQAAEEHLQGRTGPWIECV